MDKPIRRKRQTPAPDHQLLAYYPPLKPVGRRAHLARCNVPLFVEYPDGVHLWLSEETTSREYSVAHYRDQCPDVPIHTIGRLFVIVDNTRRRPRRRLSEKKSTRKSSTSVLETEGEEMK
jgi:hypothetical protein